MFPKVHSSPPSPRSVSWILTGLLKRKPQTVQAPLTVASTLSLQQITNLITAVFHPSADSEVSPSMSRSPLLISPGDRVFRSQGGRSPHQLDGRSEKRCLFLACLDFALDVKKGVFPSSLQISPQSRSPQKRNLEPK